MYTPPRSPSSRYDTCERRAAFLAGAYEEASAAAPCALCGSVRIRVLRKNAEVRVVYCEMCSLAYLAPRLTKEGYTRLYREYFQDARRSLATVDQAVERLLKKRSYEHKLPLVTAFRGAIHEGDRGLEIGAGWGTLARALTDATGCVIEAVEPSPLAARVAKEHYGLVVYAQEGEHYLAQTRERYDFVLLVHTFEHLTDPNDFLVRVGRVLTPDGKLLLALPDLSRPDEPSDRYFHIEHCFYYTPRTITFMLAKHGFTVTSILQDPHDMKVVAQYTGKAATHAFRNAEARAIRWRLFAIDAQYGALRVLKRLAQLLLPPRLVKRLQAVAVRRCTKSGMME